MVGRVCLWGVDEDDMTDGAKSTAKSMMMEMVEFNVSDGRAVSAAGVLGMGVTLLIRLCRHADCKHE